MSQSLKFFELLERLGWRKHPNKNIFVNFDGTQYMTAKDITSVDDPVAGVDVNFDEIVHETTPEQREWWMKYMYARPKITDQGPIEVDAEQESLF